MMKRASIVLVSMVMAVAFLLAPIEAFETQRYVLDNGLVILLKENHSAPVATFHLFVKAGSVFEDRYLGCGISHYIEHMLSEDRTTTRTEKEIAEAKQRLGGDANAYTTKSLTCYHMTTAGQYIEECIDLLVDGVMNCPFTPEEVETQQGVILREIAMNEDEPISVMWRIFIETMFRQHPIRYPIIGYTEQFKSLTREALLDYYHRMYVPNNMVAVAVGDFDSHQVLEKIKEVFAPFERKSLIPLYLPEEPRAMDSRRMVVEKDLQEAYCWIGFRTVPITSRDMYPLDIAAAILGKGESSRLYRRIKEELQLAHTISVGSWTPRYDAGSFFIRMTLDGENATAAENAVLDEIERLKTKPVSRKEMDKAITLIDADYLFNNQSVSDQAENLGWSEVETGDPDFRDVYSSRLREVTPKDIMAVARKYFVRENLTVALLTPRGTTEKLESEQIEEKSEPELSTIQQHVLDNGLTILIKDNVAVPTVRLQAFFRSGVRVEDDSNNGISTLFSAMMLKGTKRRSAQQIAQKIDVIGGKIGAEARRDYVTCWVEVRQQDLREGLDILSDVIINPTFPKDELEQEREIKLAAIRAENDVWHQEAFRLFSKTIFRHHPYRFRVSGQEESISRLRREDLVDYHGRYCRPNNMVLCVFGHVDQNEALRMAEKKFKKFKREEVTFPPIEQEPALANPRREVKITEKSQAVVMEGFRGTSILSEDWYPMYVMEAVLSGVYLGGGSRIHTRLREAHLVYVTHSYNLKTAEPGYFMTYAATAPEMVDTALAIIQEELERIKQEPVPDDELDRAKMNCISIHQIHDQQTNAQQAVTAGVDELLGLGYEAGENFAHRINAVTADDIMRVANRYLNVPTIVITTPQEGY